MEGLYPDYDACNDACDGDCDDDYDDEDGDGGNSRC